MAEGSSSQPISLDDAAGKAGRRHAQPLSEDEPISLVDSDETSPGPGGQDLRRGRLPRGQRLIQCSFDKRRRAMRVPLKIAVASAGVHGAPDQRVA